jgi:hypothetical protein
MVELLNLITLLFHEPFCKGSMLVTKCSIIGMFVLQRSSGGAISLVILAYRLPRSGITWWGASVRGRFELEDLLNSERDR